MPLLRVGSALVHALHSVNSRDDNFCKNFLNGLFYSLWISLQQQDVKLHFSSKSVSGYKSWSSRGINVIGCSPHRHEYK